MYFTISKLLPILRETPCLQYPLFLCIVYIGKPVRTSLLSKSAVGEHQHETGHQTVFDNMTVVTKWFTR